MDGKRMDQRADTRVINHPYKRCFYENRSGRDVGLCLSPDGPNRCHVKGCGRPESEHPLTPIEQGFVDLLDAASEQEKERGK